MGCFNAICSPTDTASTAGPIASGPYGRVDDGSSLVMTTQLNRSGPVSQGILTYSQATNRRSPWYENMTRFYSKGRWVKLPYTPQEVKHDQPEAPLTLRAP